MNKTKKLTLTALLGALIFVATTFVRLPVPLSSGYIHIGDAVIYLAACLLPKSYAILASVIGAGLSDAIGFPVYVIPTIIIKALMVLTFSNREQKIVSAKTDVPLAKVSIEITIGPASVGNPGWT